MWASQAPALQGYPDHQAHTRLLTMARALHAPAAPAWCVGCFGWHIDTLMSEPEQQPENGQDAHGNRGYPRDMLRLPAGWVTWQNEANKRVYYSHISLATRRLESLLAGAPPPD